MWIDLALISVTLLCVGVRSAFIRNVPLDIAPYPMQQHGQTLRSFNGCLQQISVHALSLKKGYLDKQNDCRQLQAEVQCLKEMVMEKEHLIEATKRDIQEDLRANSIKMHQFEKASEVTFRSAGHYRELVKKSSAKFREYKNMMLCGKGADSFLGVSGITYEQKHVLMQQLHTYCLRIQTSWYSASLKLDGKVKQMTKDMANIDYEVKRLHDSISIPDLNNGTGGDCEDQMFLCKSEDRAMADGGDLVSSSTQMALACSKGSCRHQHSTVQLP